MGGFMQVAVLLLLILLFLFGKLSVLLMILFVVLYLVFERVTVPAWNSLMGDLVPEATRGAYFGKRTKLAGIASFFGLMLGGTILGLFGRTYERKALAFVVIFTLATFFRWLSLLYIRRMYEPEFKPKPKPCFTLTQFLRRAKHTNFGNFVMYIMAMNFAVYIAAPFFSPYLLKQIGFGYVEFTILTGVSVMAKYLSMPIWGHASDKYGTRRVLALSGFLMPLVPLLYTFSPNLFYLMMVEVYGGFVWGGFELATFNYIFDSTSSEKRATCVMYHNFLNGVGILLGSLVGSLLVPRMGYHLVFAVSCGVRFLATSVFIPRIKERRRVEHIPYNKLFMEILTIGITRGIMYRVVALRKLLKKRGR